MKEYTTDKIRNIALIGHGSSGKTTLAEALLFLSKGTNRRGKIEEGTTVTDYDEEEIRRRISLNVAVAPVEWKGYKLNFLDTPGYTDFIGEVRSALRVADLALTVVDAASGVEVGSELTWGYASEEPLPHAVLINKMDRENANFEKVLAGLAEAFDAKFLPLMLPIGSQADFKGVVNVLTRKAYLGAKNEVAEVPAALAEQVDEFYGQLVEAAAESDEALMEKYFAEETLSPEEIVGGLRKVILSGDYVPVFVAAGGSELVGLSGLLDVLVDVAPAPNDRPFKATVGETEEEFAVRDDSPLALLVFKTMADPYVGKLTYFRVCGGVATSGDTLYNVRAQQDERLGQLYVVRGKEQVNAEKLHAGDIGAVAKMSAALTGDTLSRKDRRLQVRGPLFPNPLYSMSVNPKTKGDTAKMGPTLSRICEEDPTLQWRQEPSTHETIISGMGDTHVDTAVRRILGRFGVALETRTPKVPYKETVMATASAQYRHKKQTGGAGQFAEVHLRVEPMPRDGGFEYVWEVFGGRVSSSFMPSIEKGVRSVMETGVIAGYQIVDVKVAVYDGKEHPVDSKDIAFQIAGREGFKQAFREAKPVLLEPIFVFTITVPDDFAGAVMSDLNTRRARVQGIGQVGKKAVITATAPLAEMQQYATNLRAITQARGIYSMQYSHYDIVPANIAQQVVEQSKKEAVEEE